MKKKISEQSELCSDMVAEMKRFELLRRGTPDLPHFECGPFNHLGTSPYISVCFILKKFLERKAGENTEKYSIFDSENPYKQRVFRRTKRPSCRKISSQPRYDHFDTSPYIPPFSQRKRLYHKRIDLSIKKGVNLRQNREFH